MKLELLISCFALLIITVQSTSYIAEKKSSMSKYSLKLVEGKKNFNEEIEIDTEKETETFHVPKTSHDEEAGDIIYDFKRNVTMIRLPAEEACYFAHSIDDAVKPADLRDALELPTAGTDGGLETAPTEIGMTVAGHLEDRSELSAEMADLCAKLPIYVVITGDQDPNDIPQTNDSEIIPNTREKRFLRRFGRWVCKRVCLWKTRRFCNWVPTRFGLRRRCNNVRRWVCERVCRWIVG